LTYFRKFEEICAKFIQMVKVVGSIAPTHSKLVQCSFKINQWKRRKRKY